MALGMLHAAAACAAMWTGGQQKADSVVAMIAIKNTIPDRIITLLTPLNRTVGEEFAKQITELRADPATNSIVATGNADAIKDLLAMVRLVDVAPAKVALQYRLVRVSRLDGKLTETVLSDGKSLVSNNRQFTVGGADQDWETAVTVIPRINGDKTVTVATRFALSSDGKLTVSYEPGVNRIKVGEKIVSTFGDETKIGNSLSLKGYAGKFQPGRAAYRLELKIEAIKNKP